MADFAITVTNQINCFSLNPSSKWGSGQMTWGVTKWGEGTNPVTFEVEKTLDAEAVTVDQSLSTVTDFNVSLSDSIPSTFEMTDESLTDPAGYFRVFTRPTTDADTQVITEYSRQSADSTTYSTFSATLTTWS